MLAMSPRRFQMRCARFRLLAYVTVLLVSAALTMSIVVPIARGTVAVSDPRIVADVVGRLPALFYLGAILCIGQAMGRLARNRPIGATLAAALRRVGLALGIGGIVSVFLVTNLLHWIGGERGAYLNFDVAGMALALIGGALILLGHVVDSAARLQAEMDDIL